MFEVQTTEDRSLLYENNLFIVSSVMAFTVIDDIMRLIASYADVRAGS